MDKIHAFYIFLELAGTFAFAISGATAAKQRGLDMFGIGAIAFTVACGGGIIRDVCIGAIPPAGISNWRYLATALSAAALTILLFPFVQKMKQPVLLFDAFGLSLFAVTGAERALSFGHNAEVAILLGTMSAVGGGVLRDILLNRVPIILKREIYALAAMIGASIVVIGTRMTEVSAAWISIAGFAICFLLRILALRYQWNLPENSNSKTERDE